MQQNYTQPCNILAKCNVMEITFESVTLFFNCMQKQITFTYYLAILIKLTPSFNPVGHSVLCSACLCRYPLIQFTRENKFFIGNIIDINTP